ncbi:MAG: hypothetical protein HND52_20715 [Ignavibacteriae bacterium]|nr:hypothetical protein [Ignavibacteriota bacterium]NOH00395.1 hypothetical protein [Ignavibacteriota bacterium]
MYSPKLNPDLVRKLYQLKMSVGKPMTHLINEAVEEYLRRKDNEESGSDTEVDIKVNERGNKNIEEGIC